MRKVLNVGGNSKDIALPQIYNGWKHVLLDIDPNDNPDVICDAREMLRLPASEYDAVYCSHNLEHYHRHHVRKVLLGFLHVMKPDGFVHIRVPDMGALMQTVVQQNLDIDDLLGQSPAGPITVHDVIYGLGVEIERSGNDYFSHKTGFTERSLVSILQATGYTHIFAATGKVLEITAFAFKNKPAEDYCRLLNLRDCEA